jgi:hypothetical protein
MIYLSSVFKDQRTAQALIGVSKGEFEVLLNLFAQAMLVHSHENKVDFVRGRKPIIKQIEDRLFFVLFYMKTYPTFDVLGTLFGMDRTTACKLLHTLMGVLKMALSYLDLLPKQTKKELKEKFKKMKKRGYVIADGTERPIRRPSNKQKQKDYYSGKKKRHTHKNLILTNKEKAILFVSETVSGKTHDMTLAQDTDFLSSIPEEILCLFDSAFEGIDKVYPNHKIDKPTKKPRNKELKPKQKKRNKAISKKRVLVENAIAGIKRMNIVSNIFRNIKKGFSDLAFSVACGIWNLHLGFERGAFK